jgi:hypothetical protein
VNRAELHRRYSLMTVIGTQPIVDVEDVVVVFVIVTVVVRRLAGFRKNSPWIVR